MTRLSTPSKFRELRQDLTLRFRERQTVIDGCLAAVLAGEHVLLLGPPGTAKSALARAIAQAFGGRYFEWLLTKFSTPDELFGPVSLKSLEADRFERITIGKLPEADVGFIDEVFRANSAILNSMLTLLNERIYHNGGTPVACPIITLFGASNDLPEGRELEAVFDRFLLRFDLQYLVQMGNLRDVLLAGEPTSTVRVSMDELRQAQEAVTAVNVSPETIDGMISIRDACQSEGIIASDRRWKKSLKLVRASAWMMGEHKTTCEDLAILTDSLWREPKERAKVARIVSAHADPLGAQAREVLEAARETMATVVKLKAGERAQYIGGAVKAIDTFVDQKNKLSEMHKASSPRTRIVVTDALVEIQIGRAHV